ncbi:ABC transporter substrate-binding protein [Sphingobium jiangsuense]|uniref:NitT/TauT family transport system substrate-binding protein n=1 Tax=Sphingobium jiangsuense TaxID=870476 RepID=A0A7W6BCZ9_9SPHN|nr:ABC transporter substrate-binding protein [Sphingobium jiangsuense]MBB3924586.1 NitT/TauT family transport system substrate-binding protein [Sphingobium jiangsuense]GLT01704.1 ABC transporter substrate-binding protein [Sphingobium jiangsuense]
MTEIQHVPDDIAEPPPLAARALTGRRALLIGGGVALAAGALGVGLARRAPERAYTADGLRKLTLAWNANAICLAPVLLAKELGIFRNHGLEVELFNFAGPTDQMLEALSTGKADAGIGMIMRWIKPLEQGFDVRLIAGTHGGCIRMSGSRAAGVTPDPKSLAGKVIGLSDINGAAFNTFAVLLKYHGLDPKRDVEWRAYPQPLLGEAIRKGEVQAIADSDPILYKMEQDSRGDLVEVLSNLTKPWDRRVCCVVGAGGSLLRDDPESARALASSLVQAAKLCQGDPEQTARLFAPYAKASVEDIAGVLRTQTHGVHPVGTDLIGDIALYAGELRDIGVMKADTDPQRFAERTVQNLFT